MAYKNKEDQASASKRHYEANKSKIKQRSKTRNRKQRNANKAYVDKIKVESSCVDCGEGNPLVLDFDHVKGKKVGEIRITSRQALRGTELLICLRRHRSSTLEKKCRDSVICVEDLEIKTLSSLPGASINS